MLSRRFLIPVVIAIVGFAAVQTAHADPAQDATAFIDDFGHRAIGALTGPDLSDHELTARFRTLFEEGFDIPFIARSALGRFWPRATEDERTQYIALFEDYIVEIYASQFRQYSGESFEAQSSRVGPDNAVSVYSAVVRPDGPTTKLEWVVAPMDGKFKIRDIKIEGVSMITTYRDQFANEVLQHDGKVAGLIDALRQKTASLRTAGNG
ncbi:MAG TPA: ABC transporter substrate-binding protein [Alphaproteobacteria bacterium]|jgi:phospholipid transport system substrate-binding protein|nr:ABC transporter substrate-binding protein [Alphaproteobacteria bacterium]